MVPNLENELVIRQSGYPRKKLLGVNRAENGRLVAFEMCEPITHFKGFLQIRYDFWRNTPA